LTLLVQVGSLALVANEDADSLGRHSFRQLFDDRPTELPGGSSDHYPA
jgi:hypothetical protein